MDAQDIAIYADNQGVLDANIRRCGLFGLIPAAVRFLLFASAVPLSKVFGYIDDKAWMQCSRHTDTASVPPHKPACDDRKCNLHCRHADKYLCVP
jgi:hypothetical protein